MHPQIDLGFFKVRLNVAALILKGGILIVTFFFFLQCYFIWHAGLETRFTLWQGVNVLSYQLKNHPEIYLPYLFLCLSAGVVQLYFKRKKFDATALVDETSGNFGTASWAEIKDLEALGAFDAKTGPFIGTDYKGHALFLPLLNKLTFSPPGGGKTTSSSIPVLLSHEGPVFVFDIKGELWATTARYRAETLKRKVIVIDPYKITKGPDFAKGKPQSLLQDYCINPFDWLPEDQNERDRMMNAFASSFIINEGGFSNHFDENAKILIRGLIDFLMTLDKKERSLSMLYHLMSESLEEASDTFEQMSLQKGRAGAAANQINRVGTDERGSILSTSFRQIDWMGDSNMQATFSKSNFDLREFLKGEMDIYIVLPEDQVKEQSRLVRMMLSLLMSLIVQASPSDLPKKKILFLLDELAQLGACPDVEQCIEVLRARGVVVWTVFQTLSQIQLFKKPDLFLGAPLKQIFTTDDVKTMQWIQTLGGKKTIVTKTLSNNKGDSRQKQQVFGGSISKGEGESVQETGVDLIQLNEIRELQKDEQFVFLHGIKPIQCKKVRYFEHVYFANKYDDNPLK